MKARFTAEQRMRRSRRRECGFAIFFVMVGLAVAAGGAALSMLPKHKPEIAAEQTTTRALSFARDALISYATTRGRATGTARPGEFPCPDVTNDGREDLNPASVPPGACLAGLGRLPWLTIGIPEPKDSAGETLWYAIAPPFRNSASNPGAINSDTLGTLTVRVAGGATPITTQAVAVLLAPGPAFGMQNRGSAGTVTCGAANLAPNLCASNYLESHQGADNASPNGPFIGVAERRLESANDQVAYIQTRDFIPIVEQRVGAELQELLALYRESANVYPWASDWASFTGVSVPGTNRGRFPTTALPYNWNTTVAGLIATPALPSWVAANNWHHAVYYSAGKAQLEVANVCRTCSASPTLSVTDTGGAAQVSAVLLTPGTPRAGAPRPSVAAANYFEDAQNSSHAAISCSPAVPPAPATCDAYVQPAPAAIDRDRLFAITTPAVTCLDAAATLAAIARSTTCGGPGNSVIAACKTPVSQLGTCKCKSAANTLIKPPCYNVSNKPSAPKQCVSAMAQLDACIL
jgi:hypothetical protein